MTDPNSDSAKVMNAHVDKLVQGRVTQMIGLEKERVFKAQKQNQRSIEEKKFKEKHNMSDEDFVVFKERAQKHILTLDDVSYLLDREKAAKNVAQSTKEDMLHQMQNVRNIPASASGSNSQGEAKSDDRQVFENILGFDNKTDNLFG